MNILVNSLTNGNKHAINLYMKSLMDTGLIKKIRIKRDIFIITTNDNKKIKFTKILDTIEEVNEFKSNCHASSFVLMNKNKTRKINCVTILEQDSFYNSRYHTFLIYDNKINDFARNMLMDFEDYKRLFEPNIIYNEISEDIINNIIELSSIDNDFKNAEYCYLLKYAINKQINSK